MYLDHDFRPAEAFASGSRRTDDPKPSLLTGLERAAIAIGNAEAHRIGWDGFACRSSLWRNTVGALLQMLGARPVRPLADDRLELLRLYTCMRRRAHPAAGDVAARLEAAGMTRLALLEAAHRIEALTA